MAILRPALDVTDLGKALRIGKELWRAFPKKKIVVDMKTGDVGALEGDYAL